ncbi:MAG: hypothetical protein RIS88_1615, partial [Pseudomonadota bacterium]
PNATRVLHALDRLDAVRAVACEPLRLLARDALSGRTLGVLPLGASFESRYGAPYLTVHRADLHAALLQGLQAQGGSLHPGLRLLSARTLNDGVRAITAEGATLQADALVGADGLWSVVRGSVVTDDPPQPSDHVAYRALIPAERLPEAWRAAEVTVWLGPHLHAVTYPVRGGALLNVVCVVRQSVQGPRGGWELQGIGEHLSEALGEVCQPLLEAVAAAPAWGLWVLHDRAPVAGADQMALGHIALLGDAAHPMRPYLAQGAAMALEDAHALGTCLAGTGDRSLDVRQALRRYAMSRWERVARVQRRSQRNGVIFHAAGPLRMARDLVLRTTGGARVMDLPWLYGH